MSWTTAHAQPVMKRLDRVVVAVRTADTTARAGRQNAGYNQPPHPGFFLGHGMKPPPPPRIVVPK